MAMPFIECLIRSLGKPEISNSGKALVYAIVVISSQQLQSSEHAERVKQFAPGLVLSALAAVQRQQQDARTQSSRLEGQRAAVFVVRMRSGVYHPRRSLQFSERLNQPGYSRIHHRA